MIHLQSGIYKITNIVNGKYYVGSTNRLSYRWYRHRLNLRNNNHTNLHLQNAWNKYGEDKFKFTVIEHCIEKDLFDRESIYLKECEKNPKITYNIVFIPGGGGFFKGRKHTEDTKHKMREQRRGKNHPLYGKHHTDKTKEILSNIFREKFTGSGNPNFDSTIYNFMNSKTGENISSSRYDFYSKYNLDPSNVNKLIKGKINKLSGWVINN